MAHEQWREQLEASQAAYVPLITNCLLAVVILSVIRDPIVIDVVPISLIIMDGAAIALLLIMVLWLRWKKSAAANGNRFILLAISIFAVKAISLVYIENEPYPFLMAVMMFALSLCFLSHRYMLGAVLVITMAWTVVALLSLSPLQIVSTLLSMIIACVLGMFVLERRIRSLIYMFDLEKQLANLQTILPMCANCKQTRDEAGNWKSIEAYIEEKKGLQVTHGVCPQCAEKMYGEYASRKPVSKTV